MNKIVPKSHQGAIVALGLMFLTAIMTVALLAAPNSSPPDRPLAPLIREQVAEILSQPEYRGQYPTWIERLLERVGQWLEKLFERLPSGELARELYGTRPVVYGVIVGLLVLALLALAVAAAVGFEYIHTRVPASRQIPICSSNWPPVRICLRQKPLTSAASHSLDRRLFQSLGGLGKIYGPQASCPYIGREDDQH